MTEFLDAIPPCTLGSCKFPSPGPCGQPEALNASSAALNSKISTGVKLFGLRVGYYLLLLAPLGALEEKTMDVAAVVRLFLDVLLLDLKVLELEGQFIDSNHMFSCVVLQCSGQEGLREEET